MKRHLRYLIALFLLTLIPPTAQAGEGIKVGEEITICAAGPGGDIRGTPHVAYGKGVYLVVWREGWNGAGGRARIHALRLDRQGKPLDPKPSELAPCGEGFQELPRVAFGGQPFLVVWQDFRNGKDYDVLGARIWAEDGTMLDRDEPLVVADGPPAQAAPDVASDGMIFVVAWQTVEGEENAYCVRARQLRADGQRYPATEIRSPWAKAAACPRVAWDGRDFRLAFVSRNLLSVRLTCNGDRLDQDQVAALREHLGTAIRFSHSVAAAPGQGMLVVHTRSQPDYWGWGGPGAMICVQVGKDGKPDAGIPRESSPQTRLANWLDFGKEKKEGSPWPYGPSAAAWDGRQFVAVWQRQHITKTVSLTNSDLLAARVEGWKSRDEAGVPIAATPQEEKNPALASDGAGNLLCVYERHGPDGAVRIVARMLATK